MAISQWVYHKTNGQLRFQKPLAHPQNKMARQSMYFKRKRVDRPVPSQHNTSEKTSDLVRTSDPHESGEATKAGHELEDEKRMRQTTDYLEPNHLTRPQRPGARFTITIKFNNFQFSAIVI